MHTQNSLSALYIRIANNNLTVKPTRTQQRWVENISPVGGCNDNDIIFSSKAIHFYQQLVQGLFPFIVSATQSSTSVPTNCINFIYENDGRSIFLCLFKQVPHTGCTNTDKHFYEIRTRNREEWAACFSGNRSCQQGFPRSRRSQQQNTLRDSCPNFGVFLRVLQEVYNFFEFVFFFICSGNIRKCCLSGVCLILDICLAKRRILSAAICLPHHKDKQQNAHNQQQNRWQQRPNPRRIFYLVVVHLQWCIWMFGIIFLSIILHIIQKAADIRHFIGDGAVVLQGHFQLSISQIQGIFLDIIVIKIIHDFGILSIIFFSADILRNEKYAQQQQYNDQQIRSNALTFLWCQIVHSILSNWFPRFLFFVASPTMIPAVVLTSFAPV